MFLSDPGLFAVGYTPALYVIAHYITAAKKLPVFPGEFKKN